MVTAFDVAFLTCLVSKRCGSSHIPRYLMLLTKVRVHVSPSEFVGIMIDGQLLASVGLGEVDKLTLHLVCFESSSFEPGVCCFKGFLD